MEQSQNQPAAKQVDKYCINCWSGPRCCSTSLMYAFAQRNDTQASSNVLNRIKALFSIVLKGCASRPYRDLVLAAQENSAHNVAAGILGPRGKPVLYAKHIAKHKVGLNQSLWQGAQHVLLVREPYGVVQSFSKVIQPSLLELGYGSLLEIYSELRVLGRPPVVIMSDELVRHPEAVLRDVKEPLPDRLKPLLGECWPAYEMLRRHALRPLPADSVPRHINAARVSVLDSGFMLGDGVWEGLRLVRGVVAFARPHLARLYEAAKALDMDLAVTPQALLLMVYAIVDANGMGASSGVHIRLMVSRGLKSTPYQNPKVTLGKPTIVILPEWKEAAPGPRERGIRLFTVHVRRGAPDVQDPGWNSLSKLNCIAACIQANKAGVDEALMLDPHGFVATCNSVNFFIVREGEVWAPRGGYLMRGITRTNVMALCREHGVTLRECDFYLTQVYGADEAFATGTFAGILPVVEVDGRAIGSGLRGQLTQQLQQLYTALVEADVAGGREGAWQD
ncbi:branched chain amino acid aminotransferase [Scenedesmus sp. NREL 46B-D3]|nr:branched chain amino acid aminotransferase [Scenedesmus sp. NREL 46B-D3]